MCTPGRLGIERQRLAEERQRLVEPAEIAQHGAEIVARHDRVWIERHHGAVGRGRRGEIAGLLLQHATVEHRIGEGRIEGERPIVAGERLAALPRRLQREAERVMRRRPLGRQSDGLGERRDRGIEPSRLPLGEAEIERDPGILRREAERGAKRRCRRVGLPRCEEQHAVIAPGRRRPVTLLQSALDEGESAGEIALLIGQHAGEVAALGMVGRPHQQRVVERPRRVELAGAVTRDGGLVERGGIRGGRVVRGHHAGLAPVLRSDRILNRPLPRGTRRSSRGAG